MELALFLLAAGSISLSGVLAPGPITAVTAAKGAESPHAGAWVTVGHTLVEIAVMAALFFGARELSESGPLKAGIGLAGAAVLLFMGVSMLRALRSGGGDEGEGETEDAPPPEPARGLARATSSPLMAGIVLSAGNPYFIIWWLTVGAGLVLKSIEFGVIGFLLFALVHWSCDLGWNWLVSALSYGGSKALGPRFQWGVQLVCGVFLVFMAAWFGYDGAVTLWTPAPAA
jgi:threonine/homoserine/homoserine lactone efflux protein